MRVLIFGLGLLGGGFAAASYFLDRHDEVRITDLRSEAVLGGPLEILKQRGAVAVCQEHREEDFLWADLVIKNPAIASDNPYLAYAKKIETDISSVFASPFADSMEIIAITGTKGKTTTAAAVSHVLNEVGKEAMQCGNMGISGFSVLSELEQRAGNGKKPPEYLVCELSSWQIRDLHVILGARMPRFRVVVLTSMFPDHLNRYADFQKYKEDKWLLLGARSTKVIVPADTYDETLRAIGIPSRKLKAIENVPGCMRQDARLRPAWAVCKSLGIGSRQTTAAFSTFRGVPHRQEQIGIEGPIVFVNDSSATIPEAAAFSCSSCPWPYVLIAGGTDKNLQAEGMLRAVREARSLHLLDGSFTNSKLIPLLEKDGIPYEGPFNSMGEAFDSAYASARRVSKSFGDNQFVALILSPGAASFGMFRHEFDRGDQFRFAVERRIGD